MQEESIGDLNAPGRKLQLVHSVKNNKKAKIDVQTLWNLASARHVAKHQSKGGVSFKNISLMFRCEKTAARLL